MISLGIALGPDRLLMVFSGGRQFETNDVADLRQTFTELRKIAGIPSARVSVALLPPLVDLRRVALPALRPDERRRVLERDAARYFIAVREVQVVGCEGSFAAAAPARLIDDLEGAVTEAGWALRAIVPAHVAWAGRLGDGNHAFRLPHATEVLRISDGWIVERSRRRSGDATPTLADFDPYLIAAAEVPRARAVLELSSPRARATRARSTRRAAFVLSAVAALCLLLAAGVEYWGLGRELAELRSRRARIAADVAAAIQLRDSIGSSLGRAETIERLDATSPSWSSLLAELSDQIPRDASVAAFEARSDSFAITGVAREASGVVKGLERISRITRIRADGPIRQELTSEGVIREHFRFAARLAQ